MKYISLFVLLALCQSLIGQENLPDGRIEVVKNYEVRLTEAKKIRISPQPVTPDTTLRHYSYQLNAPSPVMDYLKPELKPLAINPEEKPAYYPLFAKIGYGSPNSFLANASFDHWQNERFRYGIDFHHLSANNKKIDLQKFGITGGSIQAGYLLKENMLLEGDIKAESNHIWLYGGGTPSAEEEKYRKRHLTRMEGSLTLQHLPAPESSFFYNAYLHLLSDKDNFGLKEGGFQAGGEMGSALGSHAFPLGLKLDVDYSNLKNNGQYPLNNFILQPYFDFLAGQFSFHASGKLLLSTQETEILPALEAAYRLSGDFLTIKAGWWGDIYKNNFHNLSSVNPYVFTSLKDVRNQIDRRIYGGVEGQSGSWSYEVKAVYDKFTDKAFWLEYETTPEQYQPIYDQGHYFGIEAAARFTLLKHVALRTSFFQRHYTLEHEEKPWHTPSFGGDAMVTYAGGGDTYHISMTFHGENGLPFRTLGGTVSRLKPLLDLNLHGDYFVSDMIGAFVEVNNILGNKRERWHTHPSFGFNAKAGILFRLSE